MWMPKCPRPSGRWRSLGDGGGVLPAVGAPMAGCGPRDAQILMRVRLEHVVGVGPTLDPDGRRAPEGGGGEDLNA
eukprot:3942763-Pyramimonas_sp.AAC.1